MVIDQTKGMRFVRQVDKIDHQRRQVTYTRHQQFIGMLDIGDFGIETVIGRINQLQDFGTQRRVLDKISANSIRRVSFD